MYGWLLIRLIIAAGQMIDGALMATGALTPRVKVVLLEELDRGELLRP